MSNKKATPATGAASKTKANNITSLGDYERRCLERLIEGCCERSGTTNSPQYIRHLRAKGLNITTYRSTDFSCDGRKIWWGKYGLDAGLIAKAKAMLGCD